MKTLAEELKETSLNRAIELDKERELIKLDKERIEQDRINLILQKTYDFFENNWLEKAKKAALNGDTYFNTYLDHQGRRVEDKDYDKTYDCYFVTGAYQSELYKIIMNKGISYFDSLCKQIEEQGFKNAKITCETWNWTTFSCESIDSYRINLSANF